jgi:hypothetical protein
VHDSDVEGEVGIESEHVVPHTRPLDSPAILGAELE